MPAAHRAVRLDLGVTRTTAEPPRRSAGGARLRRELAVPVLEALLRRPVLGAESSAALLVAGDRGAVLRRVSAAGVHRPAVRWPTRPHLGTEHCDGRLA